MGQWAIFISFIHGPKINMNIPPSFPTSGKLRINPWKSALFWIFWVVLLTKPYQGPVNWTWGPSTQAQDEHPRGAHAAHCGGSLRGPEDGLRTAEGKAEDLQLEADRHQETGWKPLKGKPKPGGWWRLFLDRGILIPGEQGQDFFLVGSSPGGAKQGQWIIMDWFKFFFFTGKTLDLIIMI